MYNSKFYGYIVDLVEDYIDYIGDADTLREGWYESIIHDLGYSHFLQNVGIYYVEQIMAIWDDYNSDILRVWDEELKHLIDEPEFDIVSLTNHAASWLALTYCQGVCDHETS